MIEISVVVPVYQAEDSLLELHIRLKRTLEAIGKTYEIILVDDKSNDQSWSIIQELTSKEPEVIGILLSRNFGQHAAISAGLESTIGRWVVVMDCDLQDQPEGILELYNKAISGFEVVIAQRKNRKDDLLKRLSSSMFYFVFRSLTKSTMNSSQGNFGIYSRKVIDALLQMKEQNRSFGLLINWLGFDSSSVELEHAERVNGGTTYTLAKRWNLAIDSLIFYSNQALTLMVKVGVIFSLCSSTFGFWLVLRYFLHGIHTTGWTSIIVVLCITGSFLVATNGILGIYISKMFDETKSRPIYVIDKTSTLNANL